MTPDFDRDDRALGGITTLQPDPERAARTRQRCRAIIERRARTGPAAAGVPGRVDTSTTDRAAVRRALVGAYGVLCVVYVLTFVLTTIRLQGMWR